MVASTSRSSPFHVAVVGAETAVGGDGVVVEPDLDLLGRLPPPHGIEVEGALRVREFDHPVEGVPAREF
jgi:hypothetical protein